jgi:hypothetical protein
MDQKLLSALSNLSTALEQIASALSRASDENSATTDALKGGDFVKQIKEINVGVQQLQVDTKKILKNQETIIALSKKNAKTGKKTEFEKVGGDKKRESELKKGITSIMLIAVAVLAIGVAFKLVGGINFLSVIGLSFAILILANAFEKIGRLKLTMKEAIVTSASMVMMALAITMSSWILKKVTPVSFLQVLTIVFIGVGYSMLSPAIHSIIKAFGGMSWGGVIKATIGLIVVLPAIALGMTLSSWILKKITPIAFTQALTMILIGFGFSALSPAIDNIIAAFRGMSWGQVIKATFGLVMVLPAIALGMTISSWILKKMTTISFGQALTGILIAAMFTVVSIGIKKLLDAFGGSSIRSIAKAVIFLPLVLPAIALGIVLSSYVLGKTKQVGLSQAWSAIMISFIFTVISFGLKKIIQAAGSIKNPLALVYIPILLPAMAAAIWLSSLALSKVKMMTLGQFIVSLGISILFIVFAVTLKIMSPIIGKIKPKDVVLIPLLMTTLSIAVWASSHILTKAADITFMKMLKLLIFSVVFAIAVIVLAAVAWVIGKYFGVKNVLKGSVAIVALAGTIMLSSWLIDKGKYNKYPDWKWSIFSALAIVAFGVVAWVLMKLGGIGTYIKGGIAILAVATTIMLSSHIINAGNYKNFPPLKWAIGVAASLAAFGVGAALLGTFVFGPQALVFAAGLVAILAVAGTISAASHILATGKYGAGKYPPLSWSASVALSLGAFTTGMVLLGAMIVASFGLGAVALAAGSNAVLTVARTIVKSSHILAKGNWKKGPTVEWSAGVAIALAAFSPIYKMLMANGIMSLFGGGGVGPDDFSKAIVTVSKGILTAANIFAAGKGVWKKAPTKEWSEGVAIALDAFSPIYSMLLTNGIFKMLGGGGVGPDDFSKAIVTVSSGILTAGAIFAAGKGVWKAGPTKAWAEGIGIAMDAFAPVYSMLVNQGIFKMLGGGGVGPKDFAKAIVTVSKGIITAAEEFAKNTAPFKEGMYPSVQWGQGVGAALNAFAPVFKAISDAGLFTSGKDAVNDMVYGIKIVAKSIISVAKMFSQPGIDWSAAPSKDWAWNVKNVLFAYSKVASQIDQLNVDSFTLSNMHNLVSKVVTTARLFGINKEHFDAKINPNFMKSISSNLFYYMAIAKKLQEKKGGFFGSIKSSLMGDPIIQMAKGMIELAKAYDKLATSLSKMGSAMNNFSDKKISQLERISRIKSQNTGLISGIGNAIGSVISSVGNMAASAISSPSVSQSSSKKKEEKATNVLRGKYGDSAMQNDKIIDLLSSMIKLLSEGSNLDASLVKYLGDKENASM